MIRPLRAETERYGHYSVAGEFVYDHPFYGDLNVRVQIWREWGGRYSDDWHRTHLRSPRDVVPESNMPAYSWLETTPLYSADIELKMQALRKVGVPYTQEQIAKAQEELKGKTEEDALVAYLQGLGLALKNVKSEIK